MIICDADFDPAWIGRSKAYWLDKISRTDLKAGFVVLAFLAARKFVSRHSAFSDVAASPRCPYGPDSFAL